LLFITPLYSVFYGICRALTLCAFVLPVAAMGRLLLQSVTGIARAKGLSC
jgi:hypothetical protein